MFDALEDTPRDFQVKLVDALNSLGETMQVPPTEAFNKVLCKSDDGNEDVTKKLYNWWRAFFEVLGKCEKIPNDRKTEFNQKIDDLMAEIMKAGDIEATDEEEPVMESDDEGLGYQQATKDDEDKMLADMEFAIQHIGEVANKVKAVVNFINPYCGTEVNESGDQPKFKVGDVVRVKGVSGMDFYGRDAPIGPIVKIEPPHPDIGVYEYLIKGRSGEFFAYEDELELFPERFTEENDIMDKPARYGIGDHVLYKGEECVVTDVDEDLRNDEEIYQVSRDSDKVDGLSFNDWATWDDLEPLEGFTENIGKFNFRVGDKVKVVGRGLASKGWIGVVSSVDKSSPGLPYTVDFEGRESGEYAPDELAPARGFTEEVKNTMKLEQSDADGIANSFELIDKLKDDLKLGDYTFGWEALGSWIEVNELRPVGEDRIDFDLFFIRYKDTEYPSEKKLTEEVEQCLLADGWKLGGIEFPDDRWDYPEDDNSGIAIEGWLERIGGDLEDGNKTMKFKKKVDERIGGGDSDEWVSMNDYVGEEFSESGDGKMSINLTSAEESDFESCVEDYIIQAEEKHGSESDMVIGVATSKALRWIEMICAKDCTRLNPEDVTINWADDSGAEDEFAPAKGNSKSVYDFVEEIYKNVSDYYMGSGTRGKPESDDETLMNEAKVVVDANDVWDVLELLDNDIAHTELTDLINSHLRTEEEIMDAINELCGETITKKELNTLLSGRMATLVDYLGLDVEEYENMGNFKDSGKPTSVELESREPEETKKVSLYVDWDDDGAGIDSNVVIDVPAEIADSKESDALYDYISDWIDHQDFCVNDWMITDIEGLMDEGSTDEIKGGEVKDGEKQVIQDGETKTLVAGEGDNKKPVCEMTIEQEIDDPWKLSEMLWSQGKENLQELLRSELVGEEDIMMMLEDSELRNLTSINDAFAFDFPSILDSLGLDGEAWSQNLEFKRKGDDSEGDSKKGSDDGDTTEWLYYRNRSIIRTCQ